MHANLYHRPCRHRGLTWAMLMWTVMGTIGAIGAMALIATAAPIDDRRLVNAEQDAANWLIYGHGYSNQRYSPLVQIHRGNVGRLVPAWMYQTGVLGTFPTNPLVADGRMYLSTPYNHVVALDAATGSLLWRYNHDMRVEHTCCGVLNRGVALGYGRIYMITADARLVALEQASGAVVWDVPVADPNTGDAASVQAALRARQLGEGSSESGTITRWSGYAGNMAPLVYDGLVMVGVTGAGYTIYRQDEETGAISMVGAAGAGQGLRAFMSAFRADTGELVWRWYTTTKARWAGDFVPGTGWGERFPRDMARERALLDDYPDAWRHGGGSLYAAAALDPERGWIYFGTGNPAPPLDGQARPGDNLYTASLVALDARTGELQWSHQQVPHDLWGYEVAHPPVLIDLQRHGESVPALAQAGKAGWLYVYDRLSGAVLGRSEPFVPQQNLFRAPTREGIVIAPGISGGASWSPSAWNPLTGWIYVPAMHLPSRYVLQDVPTTGAGPASIRTIATTAAGPHHGTLSAIDPTTGRIAWQVRTPEPLSGGVATTAGGLLFVGEGNGAFTARDVEDGSLLWRFQTGAGVNAPPIVYQAGGRQFVAVAAGGHKLFRFPLGNALIAFALPEH